MLMLNLPKHQGVELKKTKLVSLAKKYFSIPQKFKDYYPDVTTKIEELHKKKAKSVAVGVMRKREDKEKKSKKKRRRVGRPKKVNEPLRSITNTPSILTFFSAVNRE